MCVCFHWCDCCGARFFTYPPAYVALTGEPGSFSVLDVPPEEAKLFYSLHPKQRQVCVGEGHDEPGAAVFEHAGSTHWIILGG